jgi:hypothetical protein
MPDIALAALAGPNFSKSAAPALINAKFSDHVFAPYNPG